MFGDQLLNAPVVLADFWQYFYGLALTIVAVFLILIVLVQRGRGGGLAGAFGGMGGQSAFGAKAGDTFTRITIGASIFWLLLCIASVKFLGGNNSSILGSNTPQAIPTQGTDEPILPGTPDTTPDVTTPDVTTPDVTTPDVPSPEASTPDAPAPEASTPAADATPEATPSDFEPAPTGDN